VRTRSPCRVHRASRRRDQCVALTDLERAPSCALEIEALVVIHPADPTR
jgi:hypothetical protein